MSLEDLVSEPNRTLLGKILTRLATMRGELTKATPELETRLPSVDEMCTEKLLTSVVGQLKSCVPHWTAAHGELSALYMEFAGDTTEPFDEGGLFWGYGIGEDPDVINRELFETSGVLVMDELLAGMHELRDQFPNESYEIKEYMKVNAYALLNVAFDRFIDSDEFESLQVASPFFFFAAEHDHNRKMIYRMG